jgi:ACR3 family arsenite transporter
MFALALLFFRVIFHGYLGSEKADDYLVGAVLLGSAPCTAMVFVWTALMNGDGAYTVTQVAVNDLLLLVTYVPTVKLLAGTTSLQMPWETLLLSVALFVVVPLLVGVTFRLVMSRRERWLRWMNERLLPAMDGISMVFLLLMIVLIFMSQASTILGNLLDILCISVPLLLQTVLVWAIAVALAWWMRLPYSIGGPASLIACSNFFEMAVAVAVALYGSSSGAALATVVGVLIEVPIMLLLVWLNNRYYCRSSSGKADMIELKLSQS